MSPVWISLGKHIRFRTSILIIFYIFLLQACWTKALKAGSKNFKKTRKDPTAHVKLYTYLMSENIWRLLIGKFSCCVTSFVICLPIVCENTQPKPFCVNFVSFPLLFCFQHVWRMCLLIHGDFSFHSCKNILNVLCFVAMVVHSLCWI